MHTTLAGGISYESIPEDEVLPDEMDVEEEAERVDFGFKLYATELLGMTQTEWKPVSLTFKFNIGASFETLHIRNTPL